MALVTPPERSYLYRAALKSVVRQTVRPLEMGYLSVMDRPTAPTQIGYGFISKIPWIELLRMPDANTALLPPKVRAFSTGYERLGHFQFDWHRKP